MYFRTALIIIWCFDCSRLSKSLVDLFRTEYPDDAAIEVLAIDYYVNTKQFDAAIRSLDALDKSVRGDAYLDALRGQIYLQAGDLEMAEQCAEAAVTAVTDISQVYVVAADVAVHKADFGRTVELLEHLGSRFEFFLPSDPSDDVAWKRFYASDEYHDWATK